MAIGEQHDFKLSIFVVIVIVYMVWARRLLSAIIHHSFMSSIDFIFRNINSLV